MLLFAALMVILANNAPVPQAGAPAASPTASSTVSVVSSESAATAPAVSESQTSLEKSAPQTSAKAAKPTPPVAAPVVQAALPAISVPLTLPSSGNSGLDDAAAALRAALVNIVCYVPASSNLHSISGSGVFVDSKGIILTNAHVAQFFLLADKGVECVIRTGSPAVKKYTAELIYISPVWVRENADILSESQPIGTGENDFAFLAISGSATNETLPESFSSVSLSTLPPASGTPVVIASYGAQFLASSQIRSQLYPTIVFGSVKDVFTFAVNTIDFLALGGSAAAQEGSSGGGVVDASGKLVGTITTSTVEGATDTRSLGAITTSFVRAEYASEMGSALDLLLAEPTSSSISEFAPKIPVLESILAANLP